MAAFWKMAVRRCIKAGGGIEAVAAALCLSRSHVGRWNNLHDADLPSRDQMMELDELSLACGGRAFILEAQASQLGHVAFCLPQGVAGDDAAPIQLGEATARFGEIASEMVSALSDGTIDAGEKVAIAERIRETLAALVRLNALVTGESEPRVAPVRAAREAG